MKQVNLLLMSAAMTLAACGGTKDAQWFRWQKCSVT